MSIENVLIVDDDEDVLSFLSEALRQKKLEVSQATHGRQAFKILEENAFDLLFTDMRLPDATGIDILRKAKELNPNVIVIIITAFGSIENSVEAMHLGAFNYLIKPCSLRTIHAMIEKAREQRALIEENQYLRQELRTGGSHEKKIIAASPIFKKILADASHIAKSHASVFLTGESGTGKEVIAQAIQNQSPRCTRPYIRVNCASIPDALIESEFFGHEKGAFTGAVAKRLGRFELADGGTLLLDEVTETPLSLQAKLLRAIQEQEFERIGGTRTVKVDVRIISTSNQNVKEALANKTFREDLYYRLNVIPIHIPPLRERQEDILPLAEYFLEKFCLSNNKKIKKFTLDAERKLLEYSWPGNIRELANIIEHAVVVEASTQLSSNQLYLDHLLLNQIKNN